MPTEIPDLWGDGVGIDALPPLTILQTQAAKITERTKGMIRGNVWVDGGWPESSETSYRYVLELEAPAFRYAEEVLNVEHAADRPYPATLVMGEEIQWPGSPDHPGERSVRRECRDEEEYLLALGTALQSPPVRTLLATLKARSNDRTRTRPVAS